MAEEPTLASYLCLALFGLSLSVLSLWALLRHPIDLRTSVPWGPLSIVVIFVFNFVVHSTVLAGAIALGVFESPAQILISLDGDLPPQEAEKAEAAPEQAVPAEKPHVGERAGRLTLAILVMAHLNLVTLAAVILYLLLVLRVKLRDLGLRWDRVISDIGLGILGFLAAAPTVLMLQALLRWYYADDVKPHVIERLLRHVKDLGGPQVNWTMGVLFFSAVVVAPLVEEFFFRVMLQGWFEKLEIRFLARRQSPNADASPWMAPKAGELPQTYDNPYASSQAAIDSADPSSERPRLCIFSIVASSLLFAAAHFTQWPDPIPLFVFALMLGFLYYQTHRWLPSVVTHLCLNAFSLSILWLSLFVK